MPNNIKRSSKMAITYTDTSTTRLTNIRDNAFTMRINKNANTIIDNNQATLNLLNTNSDNISQLQTTVTTTTVIQTHIEITYIKNSTLYEIDESKKNFLLLLTGFHKNNNLTNNYIKMVSYKYNDDLSEYTIGLLICNMAVIDNLVLLLQTTLTTIINHQVIDNYNITDPYEYWIYPNNTSVTNQTWYNLPKESYGEIMMASDPFLGSDPHTNYTIGKITPDQLSKLTSITNDPMYLLPTLWYILPEINNIPVQITRPNQRNVIVLFSDQFNAFSNLPSWFTDNLPGYQAFKKIGIEFTNCYNNRQMCSPSRASFITGKMDTGINDNIDQTYQYNAIGGIRGHTNGKCFKDAGYDVTAFKGKNHISSAMATSQFIAPYRNMATNTAFKQMGFDEYQELGDDFYNDNHAFLTDQLSFSRIPTMNTAVDEVDIMIDGEPRVGTKHFLQSRILDQKSFFLCHNFTDPHDIMHYWANPEQTPTSDVLAIGYPFYEEQKTEFGVHPYYFDEFNPVMVTNNNSYTKNWFEDNWHDYKTNEESLLYYDSWKNDFVVDSTNSQPLYNYYVGNYFGLQFQSTMPSKSQIAYWKNFQNAYLNMMAKTDLYIYEVYKLLKHTKMLENTAVVITCDHGEMSGAHGLRQKGMPFKNSCNVPCLVVSPDISPELIGTKCDKIVNLYDMNPTLATLGMFDNPNLEDFTGVSLLSKNENGKLVINPAILDENIGYINNWMLWSTFIMSLFNTTNNNNNITKVPQSAIYDYSDNPLYYKFCMTYYRTHLDGHLYNYVISWDISTIIKTQSSIFNPTFNEFKLYISLSVVYANFCKTKSEYDTIIMEILDRYSEVTDFYEFYKLCETDIMNLNLDENDIHNIILTFAFIMIVFMGIFSQPFTNTDIILNNLQTKDSYLFTSLIPYTNLPYNDFVTYVENKELNEFLYDLTTDPNEINNLLTPHRTTPDSSELTNIRTTLFEKNKNKNIEQSIDYNQMTLINPISMNMFTRISELFNYTTTSDDGISLQDHYLIIMGLNGKNNMDSPSFSRYVKNLITQIKR